MGIAGTDGAYDRQAQSGQTRGVSQLLIPTPQGLLNAHRAISEEHSSNHYNPLGMGPFPESMTISKTRLIAVVLTNILGHMTDREEQRLWDGQFGQGHYRSQDKLPGDSGNMEKYNITNKTIQAITHCAEGSLCHIS